jgi:hypothetical protein
VAEESRTHKAVTKVYSGFCNTVTIASLLVFHVFLFPGCAEYIPSPPCPGGVPGKCGLEGVCVECNTSDDCMNLHYGPYRSDDDPPMCETNSDCTMGNACYKGICVKELVCSVYGTCGSVCGEPWMDECPQEEVCVYGWCEIPCQTDDDCFDGAGTCTPADYCGFKYCSPDGTCPDGMEPVKGTLACRSPE